MRSENKKVSEAAFYELYRRYSSIVHAYCLKVVGNYELAEDFFQDVFVKFYQKFDPSSKTVNVPGYLITLARNALLNYKRDKKSSIDIDDISVAAEPELSYEKRELLNLIDAALELLDFEYKEAFVLREYDGLSYKDIAEITGTSLSNAKSRVFRAKQKIKEILAPYLKEFHKVEREQ